jgi:hypothetical protein
MLEEEQVNKETLISELARNRKEILDLLDGISQEVMATPGVFESWSLKDMLVHLTRWEAELVKLLWQAQQGTQPTTVHFSQDDTDSINMRWYRESKSRSTDIVWKDFTSVREQTLRRVKVFSEQELNNQEQFKWLGGKPLWEWIADDTYKHEAEHAENIRAWKDRLGEAE